MLREYGFVTGSVNQFVVVTEILLHYFTGEVT